MDRMPILNIDELDNPMVKSSRFFKKQQSHQAQSMYFNKLSGHHLGIPNNERYQQMQNTARIGEIKTSRLLK